MTFARFVFSAICATVLSGCARPIALTFREAQTSAQFTSRIAQYEQLHRAAEASVPQLTSSETAMQIENHEARVEQALESAKARTQPGRVFAGDIERFFRSRLDSALQNKLIRRTLQEEMEEWVEIHPWPGVQPADGPVQGMPLPELLVEWLPPLPESLQYVLVRRDLILSDAETHLAHDRLANALSDQISVPETMKTAPVPVVAKAGIGLTPPSTAPVRFAVVGDTGGGSTIFRQPGGQYHIARLMEEYRKSFPFDLVLMLGDNIYGPESAADYAFKFSQPFGGLLTAGVEFRSVLGNHDKGNQISYDQFNMGKRSTYGFDKGSVRFVALDTTGIYDSRRQTAESQMVKLHEFLSGSNAAWRIAFFHHPVFSSGLTHGAAVDKIQTSFHERFRADKVDVVLNGHEHFYERIKPQDGVQYFISGGGSRKRPGDIKAKPFSAVGFDSDLHFMLMAVDGDVLYYEAVALAGLVIDCGVIRKNEADEPKAWMERCRQATKWRQP